MLSILVPIIAAGITFECTPTRVWNADGPIWCAEGPRVRLAGIAAREIDGSCRINQPCPEASADAARDVLVKLISGPGTGGAYARTSQSHYLVSGPVLSCRSEGSAGGNRTSAWCRSPVHGDLSCAMVASATVLRWDRYWGAHQC